MNDCHLTEKIRIKHPTPISELNKVKIYESEDTVHLSCQSTLNILWQSLYVFFPSLQSSITVPKGPKMSFKWKLIAEKFAGQARGLN
jgi:hypothetical protein